MVKGELKCFIILSYLLVSVKKLRKCNNTVHGKQNLGQGNNQFFV